MKALSPDEHAMLAGFASSPQSPAPAAMGDLIFRGALMEYAIVGVSWRSFVRVAEAVLMEVDGEADDWERVAFARDIARRHGGEPVLLDWPEESGWFGALDADGQLTALAHVVQSAADADLEIVGEYADAAAAKLEGAEPRSESLKLYGAMGRAYAAVGAFTEAAAWLDRAVTGWFELGLVPQASHALCELLRVHGVQRDLAAVQGLLPNFEQFLASTSDTISRVFARIALGRALIQSGDPVAGEAAMQDGAESWAAGLLHAQASRLRWLHLVDVGKGDEEGAKRRLGELDGLLDDGAPYDSDQRYLARIDRAIAEGTVVTRLVEGLVAVIPGGSEAARTLARVAPYVPAGIAMRDRAVVERMAWEYRY